MNIANEDLGQILTTFILTWYENFIEKIVLILLWNYVYIKITLAVGNLYFIYKPDLVKSVEGI